MSRFFESAFSREGRGEGGGGELGAERFPINPPLKRFFPFCLPRTRTAAAAHASPSSSQNMTHARGLACARARKNAIVGLRVFSMRASTCPRARAPVSADNGEVSPVNRPFPQGALLSAALRGSQVTFD